MNSDRTTSLPDDLVRDPHAATDRALKQALADLPAPADAARIEALNRRVLAQWQQAQQAQQARGAGRAAPALAAGVRGWLLLHGGGRSRWLAGATGLAVGLALLVGTWLHRADPALDELLQPDVLSQMAAGEM